MRAADAEGGWRRDERGLAVRRNRSRAARPSGRTACRLKEELTGGSGAAAEEEARASVSLGWLRGDSAAGATGPETRALGPSIRAGGYVATRPNDRRARAALGRVTRSGPRGKGKKRAAGQAG